MNTQFGTDLETFLAEEACRPVRPAIAAIAEAARVRHGGVGAVLFYGSCLRDGDEEDKIADLYLLVDSYRAAYASGITAFFNWALPPNVSYIETQYEGRTVRAKYAVISIADFERGASGRWLHSYIWARFSQPCRLAYWRGPEVRLKMVQALADAVRTLARETAPLMDDGFSISDFWVRAFRETYRAELRAERPGRAAELYELDRRRYDRIGEDLLREGLAADDASPGTRRATRLKWVVRRPLGKFLSIARLIKAAFTFQDGTSYILWKIERHSGVAVTPTAWQRRHPILASTALFWRLYSKGAFR